MAFNLKSAVVDANSAKDAEKKLLRKEYKRNEGKNFNVYVVRCINLIEHRYARDFNLRVWSKIDRRYVYNTYTNDWEKALEEILKMYKKSQCIVIDLLKATKEEIREKYRLR